MNFFIYTSRQKPTIIVSKTQVRIVFTFLSPSQCFQLLTNLDKDIFRYLLSWGITTIFTNAKRLLLHILHCKNKIVVIRVDQRKRHSNFADWFCCIHIFSAKLLICSLTFSNLLTYLKTRAIVWVPCTFLRESAEIQFVKFKLSAGALRLFEPSTTDNLFDFYKNKTKQYQQT